MKIPFVKNSTIGYLDDVAFGFVSSESDLTLLAEQPVGFIAVQYGFGAMWQKKDDGTWEAIE